MFTFYHLKTTKRTAETFYFTFDTNYYEMFRYGTEQQLPLLRAKAIYKNANKIVITNVVNYGFWTNIGLIS